MYLSVYYGYVRVHINFKSVKYMVSVVKRE